MCLLCSSDTSPCKADVLSIAWGGVEVHRKSSKSSFFADVRGLVLGTILQKFISLSIQDIRSSFSVKIEVEVYFINKADFKK